MDNESKKSVNDEVMSNAAKGVGFVYGRHLVTTTERNALPRLQEKARVGDRDRAEIPIPAAPAQDEPADRR